MEPKPCDVPDVQTLNTIEDPRLPGGDSLFSGLVVRPGNILSSLLRSFESHNDANLGPLFEEVGQVGAIAQLASVTWSPDDLVRLAYGDLALKISGMK
jgi:hypothetical protein